MNWNKFPEVHPPSDLYERYIVTAKFCKGTIENLITYIIVCEALFYSNYWTSPGGSLITDQVIAWMPFPEPFKE